MLFFSHTFNPCPGKWVGGGGQHPLLQASRLGHLQPMTGHHTIYVRPLSLSLLKLWWENHKSDARYRRSVNVERPNMPTLQVTPQTPHSLSLLLIITIAAVRKEEALLSWEIYWQQIAHGLNQRKDFGFAIQQWITFWLVSDRFCWYVCVLISEGGHVLVKGIVRMHKWVCLHTRLLCKWPGGLGQHRTRCHFNKWSRLLMWNESKRNRKNTFNINCTSCYLLQMT